MTATLPERKPDCPRREEQVPDVDTRNAPGGDGCELSAGDAPTKTLRSMQEAEADRDFARACFLVRSQANGVARETRKQMQATGRYALPEFWEASAEQARLALWHWHNGQELPLSVVVARMETDDLHDYADALCGRLAWTELVF